MKNLYKKIKAHIPLTATVIFALTFLSVILHITFLVSSGFADFFNIYIASFFRAVLAHISGIFPFSIAELIFVSLPVIALSLLLYSFYLTRQSAARSARYIFTLLSVSAMLYSIFVLDFASAYNGTTIDKKLNLEQKDVTANELYKTAILLKDEINAHVDNISFGYGSNSVMPYSFDDMTDKLVDGYNTLSEEYSFIPRLNSRIKPIVFSNALTYTHISGLYSFFTGEANLNMNFPDYSLPFTAAHELAHQRGVAREDEANFLAFIVCINSQDEYIRYSGYMSMYEYVISALYDADKALYSRALSPLSNRARYDIVTYNRFFEKYKNSVVSSVSGAVNDAFLKLQGTEGAKSYGMVVDLAVAYYSD